MTASRRELILQELETTLWSMVPGAQYSHHLATVSRGTINPLDLQSYPAVLIIPTSDIPEAGASSVSRRVLHVVLRLWVRPHQALSEALEALIQDIQQLVLVDVRRGGLAELTLEGELHYLYLDSQALEAGADLEYQIHYRTALADPMSGPV
jgi:hypothetical protein